MEDGDVGQELGSAFARKVVRPQILWCLDAAMGELAERLVATDPSKRVLQAGIVTRLLCMLTQEVQAGRCEGLAALGILANDADGAYAEETEEMLFELMKGNPDRVSGCWASFTPYQARVGLGTTGFCAQKQVVLRAYAGRGAAEAFLKDRAAQCAGGPSNKTKRQP